MELTESRFCPRCAAPLRRAVPTGDTRERLVCPQCTFIFYVGPKIAAGTVPILDGGIVLIRRGVPPRAGFWSFPCGYVEWEETLEAAAVRETHEEAGLSVTLTGLLGAYSYPASPQDPHRVVIAAFGARVVDGVPRAGDDAEAVRIFRPAEIPWDDLAFRSSHDALRAFLARR